MAIPLEFYQVQFDDPSELSDEQMEEIRSVFNLYDRDQDGHITAKELASVFQSVGQNTTEDQVLSIINEVDVDGDGTIDFSEFLAMVIRKLSAASMDVMEAFEVFDRDGDGFISVDEMRQMMIHFGEDVDQARADEMLREADTDGDGQISYDEFQHMIYSNL